MIEISQENGGSEKERVSRGGGSTLGCLLQSIVFDTNCATVWQVLASQYDATNEGSAS